MIAWANPTQDEAVKQSLFPESQTMATSNNSRIVQMSSGVDRRAFLRPRLRRSNRLPPIKACFPSTNEKMTCIPASSWLLYVCVCVCVCLCVSVFPPLIHRTEGCYSTTVVGRGPGRKNRRLKPFQNRRLKCLGRAEPNRGRKTK